MDEQRKRNLKTVYFVVFIIVLIGLTVLCVPLVNRLTSEEGRAQLEDFFSNNAILGVIVFLILQVVQVVVALIPGGIIQIIAGVAFGGVWGTILSLVGVIIGTYIVFILYLHP